MTRLSQFARGVSSSWLATFAAIVYSLLSVPIALRFLNVEEFGLLVLLLQVAGYFTLIEIGMSAATARILVDYKDNANDGRYGSVILTSFYVFAVQALIILCCGIPLAPWIVSLIGVPAALTDVAIFLLRWLTIASALIVAFRVYGSILYANKRLDLVHAFNAGSMIFALSVLLTIFVAGGQLPDLVWLFLAQAAFGIIPPLFACYKLGLMPKKGCWGKPSLARFREVFGFGKDVFLINVGNQVLEASQLIIISRTMGLTAAAIWSVSTKLFSLVYQLVTKIAGTAIVFFAEMMVRGENQTLATRFRQIYQLTAGTAVISLAVAVAVNQPFVSVWASPSLAWSLSLSFLVAACVLINAIARCSGDFIIHTKNIAAFRYVYFVEAATFVVLSLLLSQQFGFYGVLGSCLVCVMLFRATYTTWRIGHYFGLPFVTFWWTWLRRSIAAGVILIPFVLSAGLLASNFQNAWSRLFITLAWIGVPAVLSLFLVALPRDVRREFALRFPQLAFLGKHLIG